VRSPISETEIAALVAKHQENQDAKFAGLEAELNSKFQECEDILASIKQIRPDYKASWQIVEAPQQCALDIQAFLKGKGGYATKGDVVAALEEKHTSGKVEKTLVNRCAGERPLWTYSEPTETYTLIKTKKNNNNN